LLVPSSCVWPILAGAFKVMCMRELPHSPTSTPQPRSSNNASLTPKGVTDIPESLKSLTANFKGHGLRRKTAAMMVGLRRAAGLTAPHAAQLPGGQRWAERTPSTPFGLLITGRRACWCMSVSDAPRRKVPWLPGPRVSHRQHRATPPSQQPAQHASQAGYHKAQRHQIVCG
jgi:hypothetical protein